MKRRMPRNMPIFAELPNLHGSGNVVGSLI